MKSEAANIAARRAWRKATERPQSALSQYLFALTDEQLEELWAKPDYDEPENPFLDEDEPKGRRISQAKRYRIKHKLQSVK